VPRPAVGVKPFADLANSMTPATWQNVPRVLGDVLDPENGGDP